MSALTRQNRSLTKSKQPDLSSFEAKVIKLRADLIAFRTEIEKYYKNTKYDLQVARFEEYCLIILYVYQQRIDGPWRSRSQDWHTVRQLEIFKGPKDEATEWAKALNVALVEMEMLHA